jgi:uncharacterized protein YodC (DUF2158 family)
MKKGDRVRLRSGGPMMTVVALGGIFRDGEVQCEWFSTGGLKNEDWFAIATLMLEEGAAQ